MVLSIRQVKNDFKFRPDAEKRIVLFANRKPSNSAKDAALYMLKEGFKVFFVGTGGLIKPSDMPNLPSRDGATLLARNAASSYSVASDLLDRIREGSYFSVCCHYQRVSLPPFV